MAFALLSMGLVAELYLRYTRAPSDLMALTGRRIGENPMQSWAMVDAYSAYRSRPGKLTGLEFNRSYLKS